VNLLASILIVVMSLNAPHLAANRKAGPLKGSRSIKDLTPTEQEVFTTPSIFAERVLGMKLYPKQAQCLDMFAPNGARVSGRFCNEYGKTTKILSAAILWHTAVFPRTGGDGGSITTSGSWNQILNQLVPSLKAHQAKFPQWRFMSDCIEWKGYPQWLGFSTKDAGRAEGFHGSPARPLLAVVDEAKSVPDPIFQAIEDRCNPQRYGLLSSPGYSQGEFYRSQTTNARLYSCFHGRSAITDAASPGGWKLSGETPHIVPETIERRIAKWGIDHALVKSMIFSEFMEICEGAYINLAQIEDCIENPPSFSSKPERKAFLDFAGGGDENVIAMRMGNKVWIADAWRDQNEMASVGRFIIALEKLKREYGLKPEEVEGDASGLGAPMISRIQEAGWMIGEAFNGNPPRFDTHYFNLASEMWLDGCEAIKRKQVIIPNDDDFKAQATNRRMIPHSKGLLRIETKEQMRDPNRKGGAVPCSPDRAEAIFGAIAPCPNRGSMNLIEQAQGELDEQFQDVRIDETILAGAFAG
jgi:phage terminase large subunit